MLQIWPVKNFAFEKRASFFFLNGDYLSSAIETPFPLNQFFPFIDFFRLHLIIKMRNVRWRPVAPCRTRLNF